MAAGAFSDVMWWLVDHPSITSFEWTEHHTWGASRRFLFATVLTYLALTFLLLRLLRRPRPPLLILLRIVFPLHNLFLLLLSLVMAAGCSLSALAQMPSTQWLFCFPRDTTRPRGPVFFWAYVFYLSKIYEFLDTLLILLAADRRRLSFLHVYHHAVVVAMCYVWLSVVQSLLPVALVTNASVHVVMYAYYLSSSLGWRWSPRWKRAVTNCQIFQFAFSFAVSLVLLWLHFFGGGGGGGGTGCSGMMGWVFNAIFNASLLALFLDFHKANYSAAEKKNKNRKQ